LEDGEVEGVTEFRRGEKPTVKISSRLTENRSLVNRLRTTLTHEFGHVHFHDQMFQVETKPASLFDEIFVEEEPVHVHANRCKRETVVSLDKRDWMEWQAGFVCGAILMPVTSLIATVREFRRVNCLELSSIAEKSPAGAELITLVAKEYLTSRDAARIRLLQRQILSSSSMESLL
jgi:Zn-dependent peptidase ImmA (M78 family)